MLLSVLEGVGFAIRDNIEIARAAGVEVTESTVCGGGAKSELWLKILANILNIKLLVPKDEQGVGYGAAILAMQDIGKIKKTEIKSVIAPEPTFVLKYNAKYEKYKNLYPALKNYFQNK